MSGEIGPPCGVPFTLWTRLPSGISIGAFSHRSTYSRTHFWSVWRATALSIRSHGTVSKKDLTSRSTAQSFLKHRCRHAATASRGERPGRYPYESSWNTFSTFGSTVMTVTVCATLSTTLGMPSVLIPPFLGISTARTGPGKYDPDDIRDHSLERLSFRFASNCSIVTPSAPAAPPFPFTFSHASHTCCFGMFCDLPCNLGSCIRFLPSG